MRRCVIGIGNELREDDGVGLVIVRKLRTMFNDNHVELLEIGNGLFDIPEIIMSYDSVVILDALPPGPVAETIQTVYCTANSQPLPTNYSLHDLDLFWQLGYAYRNGFHGEVIFIGITAYSFEYRTELSPELLKALPEIVLKVAGIIQF
jgi:hydrogenase maturation protease